MDPPHPPGARDHRRGRHGRRGWDDRLSYLGARCCETPVSCASAPRRAARLRQSTLRGPCGAAPTGSRARRGCSSELGNRACGHDDGCWAGRCACSREVLLVRGIRLIRITSAAFHGPAVPDPDLNQREESADASGQASLRHRRTTGKTGSLRASPGHRSVTRGRRRPAPALGHGETQGVPCVQVTSSAAVDNSVDQCTTGTNGHRRRPGRQWTCALDCRATIRRLRVEWRDTRLEHRT